MSVQGLNPRFLSLYPSQIRHGSLTSLTVLEQPDDMWTGNQSIISQYRFVKCFQVGEGTWQYKFRLGLGD